MLKIGEFSRLAMVTVKALRFYDEEGLLKPNSVDQWTGYRYYDSEQLCELNKIVSLRQAGLSISEIKNVISGNDVLTVLTARQKELQQELSDCNERYLRITKIITNFKENKIMDFQATIKEIPSCTVYLESKSWKIFPICRSLLWDWVKNV